MHAVLQAARWRRGAALAGSRRGERSLIIATDAIIVLKQLRCLQQESERASEPYLWPVLVWIDDHTLATPEQVKVVAPLHSQARVVLQSGLRAGDTVAIPPGVGTLRVRFEDGLTLKTLILAVALWEEDETPTAAMRAGFTAFIREQGAAVKDNLSALFQAQTEEDRQLIRDRIAQRVAGAVRSAIEEGLTGWQKARVFAGLLNLDDFLGGVSKSFPPPPAAPAPPAPGLPFPQFPLVPDLGPEAFTLSVTHRLVIPVLGIDVTDRYELEGELLLRRVPIELCRSEVAQVQAAQAAVDDVHQAIQQLQAELQQASPAEKVLILQEIQQLKDGELADATAQLEAARRALQACRDFWRRRFEQLPDLEPVPVDALQQERASREADGARGEGRGGTRVDREPLRP